MRPCLGCGRTHINSRSARLCHRAVCVDCGERRFSTLPGTRCRICDLKRRLRALLQGTWLEPLIALYLEREATHPEFLYMLDRARGALLRELVREPLPVEHAWFIMRSERAAFHLQADLVAVHLLPPLETCERERAEYWAFGTLRAAEQHIAHEDVLVLRRYLVWFRLPRDFGPNRYPGNIPVVRYELPAVCAFLAMLHQSGSCLKTSTLADWEQYVVARTQVRDKVGPFLRWAHRKRLLHYAPAYRPEAERRVGLGAAERRGDLERLAHDEAIPLDVRVAGFLAHVGFRMTRIRRIKRAEVRLDAPLRILIDSRPYVLRSEIAALVERFVIASYASPKPNPGDWLFPGRYQGQPASPLTLRLRLRQHGFAAAAARTSFFLATAQHMPALAATCLVLGLHPLTMARWRKVIGGRWALYVKLLADGTPAPARLAQTAGLMPQGIERAAPASKSVPAGDGDPSATNRVGALAPSGTTRPLPKATRRTRQRATQ